jgi:hypothetical protein
MTRFKWLFCALLLTALFGTEAQGQVVNAASCSLTDVQAALSGVTASTATVNIPAGTCTWTTGINYTVPAGSMSLSIIGQTSCPGTTPSSCTDNTVIIDNVNHSSCNCPLLGITGNAMTSSSLRLSGLTIEQSANSVGYSNGIVGIGGYSQNFRMDHNHFVANSGVSSSSAFVTIYNALYGVVDHNVFDMPPGGVDNGVRVSNGGNAFGDSSGNGNGSWANPTNPGSANALYFENNTSNHSIINDCNDGGRQVFRFNVFNDSSIQSHEMESDARGCRYTEVYKNTFNGNPSDNINSFAAVGYRMGTGLVWGNASTNMANLIMLGQDRTNGHPFGAPPGNWGYCGTEGAAPGPSGWDFNSNPSGYPCVDQVGRGQSDVLTGNFPKKCDSTTGCTTDNGAWPHNMLEPVYEWMNQYQVNGSSQKNIYDAEDKNTMTANQDYYAYTLAWNGTSFAGTAFNGTVGTGSGILASLPSTCTAGPSGAQYASPTGHYGVAYWATDANSGNGGLYVCTATNTWTPVYTPYTYPHPLTVDSGAAPAPPTNLTAVVQ